MLNEFGGSARRWVLFGLNVFFLIALFKPFFSVDMLISTISISVWDTMSGEYFAEFILDEIGWTVWLVRLSQLMLIGIPIVHGLKLLGVFGCKMKDSAVWGVILSAGELIALIGLPITIFLSGTDLDEVDVSEALGEMSAWFYVWVVLTVISIVLAARREEPPKAVCDRKASELTKCPACGKTVDRNNSLFCGYCGTDLAKTEPGTWVCPVCGTHGKENDMFCSNCGAINLK